jgi:type VI protein secretion system component Hcp
MKTFRIFVLFSAVVCSPLFAYQDVTLTFKGKPLLVSGFNWGDGRGCASGQIHFTATPDNAPPLVQACRTNEEIPEIAFTFFNEHHVLQGAHVSCQNNMFTIRFARCSVHAKVAPVAASLLPQPATLAPAYDSLLLGDSQPDNATLVSLRQLSPNTVVITQKAAPSFFKNCVSGAHYKKVVIQMRKAGGTQFLKVNLNDALISGYSRTADGSTSITLTFASSDAPLPVRQ